MSSSGDRTELKRGQRRPAAFLHIKRYRVQDSEREPVDHRGAGSSTVSSGGICSCQHPFSPALSGQMDRRTGHGQSVVKGAAKPGWTEPTSKCEDSRTAHQAVVFVLSIFRFRRWEGGSILVVKAIRIRSRGQSTTTWKGRSKGLAKSPLRQGKASGSRQRAASGPRGFRAEPEGKGDTEKGGQGPTVSGAPLQGEVPYLMDLLEARAVYGYRSTTVSNSTRCHFEMFKRCRSSDSTRVCQSSQAGSPILPVIALRTATRIAGGGHRCLSIRMFEQQHSLAMIAALIDFSPSDALDESI
ncbi:hypothetical protein CCHR01_00458 [Colletotrichum chrysophilum]|uniref:Uncharacterized protein n=1 Tax=Colletotrichum chrysophilum TaxID=1836956 RepID=A0AAD9AYP3_9PEZI|nr:hypothetical protein CCHR01_00458 [Colletotrichum chrysophilum]